MISSVFLVISATVILSVLTVVHIVGGDNRLFPAYNEYHLIADYSHPNQAFAENGYSDVEVGYISLLANNKSSTISQRSYPPSLPSAGLTQGPCIFYDTSLRTINVCGGVVSLDAINEIVRDPSLLNNTSDKIWFLNANITVLDGATLVVSSSDTKWLKINSTSANSPHSIVSRGNLIINNTKISSWNTTSDQETTLSDFNTPRSYIALLSDARGHMNITNSNLTNLGFNGGQGTWGISYYSGGGSIIQNSNLSSNYRSLYFGQNASDIFVSNNTINNSVQTGLAIYKSSNIDITDNEIRNNGLQGIACLQQCNTIMVKDNEIYSNIRDGIRFDKRTTNSSLQNNHIYDNALSGIAIRNSSGNIITGNSLYNNKVGITLVQNSATNTINNNSIQNSSLYGMHFQSNSNSNRVEKNTLNYSQRGGIAINEAKNNTFFDNRLANNSNFGMRFRSASENILTDNIVLDNMPYNFYFKSSSTSNSFKNTIFDNSSIRFFDNTSIVIIENTDNILTANNKKIPTIAYATNTTLYLVPTTKNIVVDTLDMAVTPSNNHVNISSISKDFKTNTNYKKWIETSESPEIESKYIIGDFDPNTQIGINVNGSFWNAFTSNATGHITFLYDKASRQNSLIAEFEAYPSNHAAISVIVLFGIIVAASAGTILVRRFFKTNNSSKPMDPPMNKSLQKQFKESA